MKKTPTRAPRPTPDEPLPAEDGRSRLVVVGNGPVGWKLCERLAAGASAGRSRLDIVVFGEEPRPAYDRVRLSDLFAHRDLDRLSLGTEDWYRERGITLRLGDPVVEIEPATRRLRTRSGQRVVYDRLVLATGSRAFVPPLPGVDSEGVFVYRTVADVEAIAGRIASLRTDVRRRAAVLGGGLLGLEAAKILLDAGLEVHVVEMASVLMPKQLDTEAAALLRREVERLGVRVHTLAQAEAIEPQPAIAGDDHRRLRLRLKGDDDPIDCDLVVVSAGIRPRDELAREAGLAVAPRGGIVVSDRLETSDPRIAAIGECVAHRDTVYGLVDPGFAMASVLASRLTSRRVETLPRPLDAWPTFRGHDQSSRLKVLGVPVVTLGDFLRQDPMTTAIVFRDDAHYRKLILKRNRLVGFVGVGVCDELPRLAESVQSRRTVRPSRQRRFAETGRLWDSPLAQRVAEWPAGAIVCSCRSVCRSQLSVACERLSRETDDAADPLASLMASTGAGTVCGSCRPLLADLLGRGEAVTGVRGWLALGVVSVIAAAALAAGLLIGPPEAATSIRSAWFEWERLLRGDLFRQTSGFALLAAALLAALLPLRKRWPRLASLGTYGLWRAAHAGVGLLCVFGLLVHAGLSLGQNLNLALSLSFLATLLLGAATGVLGSLESRPDHVATAALKRAKLWIGRLHVAVVWPLPVLVLFHVLLFYLAAD